VEAPGRGSGRRRAWCALRPDRHDPACGIAAAVDERARPSRVVGHDVNDRVLRIAHRVGYDIHEASAL
jgi:hypothetical protein